LALVLAVLEAFQHPSLVEDLLFILNPPSTKTIALLMLRPRVINRKVLLLAGPLIVLGPHAEMWVRTRAGIRTGVKIYLRLRG
jgi:hypothetical protein